MTRRKVIGVGLNKTGTKTLARCLETLGYDHIAYDESNLRHFEAGRMDLLWAKLDAADSCDDWPWPLFWREIAERYPDAVFVLTVRASPERWLRSLISHANRLAVRDDVDKRIYGYRYPQNAPSRYLGIYERHNAEVSSVLGARVVRICWETGDGWPELCAFLGEKVPETRDLPWENRAFQTRRRLRLLNHLACLLEKIGGNSGRAILP